MSEPTFEINPEVLLTLEEAVAEVLGLLTGLDLTYDPSYDRFRVIARTLNRALRANALEHDWSYYSRALYLEPVVAGGQSFDLTEDFTLRPRAVSDDAARLVDLYGETALWAYYIPRDALHKYRYRPGYWYTHTRNRISFSKPFTKAMEGWSWVVPVMREPRMFEIPATPADPADAAEPIAPEVLSQPLDFDVPDVITARAAYLYALTDPVMQPRAQTLEAAYKDLMYQAIERDERHTAAPYMNSFVVPVQGSLYPERLDQPWPLADRRR